MPPGALASHRCFCCFKSAAHHLFPKSQVNRCPHLFFPMFHEARANRWLVEGIISTLRWEFSALLFMECADSIKIVLYMAPLRVMPSHYRAVSVVHMRRKVLDKRRKGEYACYARWSDDTQVPESVFTQLSWLNGGVCGKLSAVGMHLFGGFGTLQWLLMYCR